MVETEVITRVITFFFPYGTKVRETSKWYPGDSRDYSSGHPNGHEMWGHGQRYGKWEDDDDWDDRDRDNDDWGGGGGGWEDDKSRPNWEHATKTPSTIASSWQTGADVTTISSIQETSSSDDYIELIFAFYVILLVVAFTSNILVAATIKKFKWGMKMGLLFQMCLVGALVCITNSLHFLATVHHLVKRSRNTDFILQLYAVIAWLDYAVQYALLVFIMFFAIFCFKFYWNNKTRRIDWGRSYILYAVILGWLIAFLLAFFSAFFECDSHIMEDEGQCIQVICATSNIFSAIFTELLTRVRIVIPIIIIFLILLSVRVGSSKQKRESVGSIEGADIHGDSELMLICSLLFIIYELSMLIPQLFQFFCISPLITVCAYHFGVLIATLATPIAIIVISQKTRARFLALYTCSTSRTVPQGSFTHVAKKYKDTNNSTSTDQKPRRQSTISLVSQEHMSDDEYKFHKDPLNVIPEEVEPPKYEEATKKRESSATSHIKIPIQELAFPSRRATFAHSQTISNGVDTMGRRFSSYDLPPVENNRFMVEYTKDGPKEVRMKISRIQGKPLEIMVKPANS